MQYQAFSISVQGESHKTKGIVMQDFSGHQNGSVKIAAVSDGHGSPDCFRSDRGSAFAVKVCMEGFQTFAREFNRNSGSMPEKERLNKETLKQFCNGVIGNWNLAVNEDFEKFPVTEEEMEKCSDTWKVLYRKKLHINHMYGATLIGILLFEDQLLVFHQGDGRCVLITSDGKFCEPVPWDEDCQGNLTTSLCDDDAAEKMRIYSREIDAENPVVGIFAASDGIEDSYRNHEIMYNFYRRFCIQAAKDGLEAACALYEKEELAAISKAGSGDDMSLAGIVNIELLDQFQEEWIRELERIKNNEIIRRIEERLPNMEKKRTYLKKMAEAKKEERESLFQEQEREKKKREDLETNLVCLKEEKENNQKALEALDKKLQELQENLHIYRNEWQQRNIFYRDLKLNFQRQYTIWKRISFFGTFLQGFLGAEGMERYEEYLFEEKEKILKIKREQKEFQNLCTDFFSSIEACEKEKQQKERLLENLNVAIQKEEEDLRESTEKLFLLEKQYVETEVQEKEKEEAVKEYEEKYQQQVTEYEAAIKVQKEMEKKDAEEAEDQTDSNDEISIF